MLAVCNDDLNETIHLINVGCDINLKNNEGNTELIYACYNNRYKENKADVDIKDNDGETALIEEIII